MKRNKTPIVLLIPLIALVCLGITYFSGSPVNIPEYAKKLFGPPDASLTFQERVYLTFFIILHKNELTQSGRGPAIDIPFQVELGESPISVSVRLHESGLIQNPEAFTNFLRYRGFDTRIQAGDYNLNSGLTPIEIARMLQDPTPQLIEFGILAGWRAEEVAFALTNSGLEITPEAFLMLVQDSKLEGYLFPGVYKFDRKSSPQEILSIVTEAFNSSINNEMLTGIDQLGLSLHEAIILASIVEREAVDEDEMPLIASVFLNRINAGMKLDADPTVQYALGYNTTQETWWTNPLSLRDLEINSPYNTYIFSGLPPGPICNPGINAIRSISFPATTPYYYFRASCDGSGQHTFSKTFDEHIQKQCP